MSRKRKPSPGLQAVMDLICAELGTRGSSDWVSPAEVTRWVYPAGANMGQQRVVRLAVERLHRSGRLRWRWDREPRRGPDRLTHVARHLTASEVAELHKLVFGTDYVSLAQAALPEPYRSRFVALAKHGG